MEAGEKASILLPAFDVRWIRAGVDKPEWYDLLLRVEVSGVTKRISQFSPTSETSAARAFDLRSFATNSVPVAAGPRGQRAGTSP